tara:strand:+ start:17660 stop:19462 length:1803 start_codon:yes stop_codon:yes gene_type:complete
MKFIVALSLAVFSSGFLPKKHLRRVNVINRASPQNYWALSDLYKNIEEKNIRVAAFADDESEIKVLDNIGDPHIIKLMKNDVEKIENSLKKNNIRFDVLPKSPPILGVIGNVLPTILFLGIFLAMFRSMNRVNGNSPFQMTDTTQIEMEPVTGVTFDDVAGCDESKLELQEVVDFLKNPEKYNSIGAVSPKGVLLEGPPGTGKTLLARAVAGEAQVPFVSVSGSEFVEVFVGVGAGRVRNMFQKAKDNAPCIVFIDEIDSIGKSRSSGPMSGGNDEREQTLNQILAEMDGFSGNTGVIVLAATNRADILDSALLRPGRFDRRVPVGLPSKDGRFAILKVHTKNKPLNHDVDLDEVASRTIGFSGASLKNLMNEAAIISARNGKTVIDNDSIDYAIDRIQVGIAKPIGPYIRKELVAYHEAGHAVMAALTKDYDNITKVTIIPRSNGAGGFTLFTPSEERVESGLYSQKYLKSQLAVALGGRVAEELQFGEEEITTGASSDLQRVKQLARQMITQWGFKNSSSYDDYPISWEPSQYVELSSETQNYIDDEIKKLIKSAYELCRSTLKENKKMLDLIAEELVEFETISGETVMRLIKEAQMS